MLTSLSSNILHLNSRRFRLTALLLLSPLIFYAQTLTGLWIGAVSNDSTTVRKDQSFEIALTEYKGKVYGYSRSEFIVDDVLYYVVKRVKGTIQGDVCEVVDEEIIAFNFPSKLDKGVKVTSVFRRNENDSMWYLDGTWKTNKTKNYYSVSGKISLAEEKDLSASKIFPHLEELNIADKIAFYKERKEGAPIVKLAKPEKDNKASLINPATADLTQKRNEIATQKNDLPVASPSHSVVARTNTETVSEPEEKKISGTYTPVTEAALIDEQKTNLRSQHGNRPATNGSVTHVNRPVIPPVEETKEDLAVSEPKVDPTEVKPAYNNPDVRQSTEVKTNSIPAKTKTPEKQVVAQNTQAAPVQSKPAVQEDEWIDQNEVIVKRKPVQQQTVPSKTAPTVPEKKLDAVKKDVKEEKIVIKAIPQVNTSVTQRNGAAAAINDRKTEVSQVVNFRSDSLLIALYDNGQIDGDTVSVLMNGEVIMSKQGLKASAIRHTIYLPEGQEEFHLVLYAENLGTYPPNTGLLVVRDGEDVYNLRFSSDFQKNTGIVFRRKK